MNHFAIYINTNLTEGEEEGKQCIYLRHCFNSCFHIRSLNHIHYNE